MFTVTNHGLDAAIRSLEKIQPGQLQRALRQAVMKTLRQAKRAAGEKISSRYTISATKVTKTIKLKSRGLNGSMTSTGGRHSLKEFQIHPRNRPKKMPPGGVFAMNVRGQGGYLRHAFIWTTHVFERMGCTRLKIRKLTGPSAPGMLSNPHVAPFIVRFLKKSAEATISDALAVVIPV